MSGEKRTNLIILTIAVLSLIVAGVFAPRIGVEANASPQPTQAIEDVSDWLLRFAAWLPSEAPAVHPGCPPAAIQAAPWWPVF